MVYRETVFLDGLNALDNFEITRANAIQSVSANKIGSQLIEVVRTFGKSSPRRLEKKRLSSRHRITAALHGSITNSFQQLDIITQP